MYNKIVREFLNNPRDVHTVPKNAKEHRWFYVFSDNGCVCIESAHNNFPKCTVKKRLLPEKECQAILDIYHRRAKGEKISKEAQKITYSQVYWYGIFSEMGL